MVAYLPADSPFFVECWTEQEDWFYLETVGRPFITKTAFGQLGIVVGGIHNGYTKRETALADSGAQLHVLVSQIGDIVVKVMNELRPDLASSSSMQHALKVINAVLDLPLEEGKPSLNSSLSSLTASMRMHTAALHCLRSKPFEYGQTTEATSQQQSAIRQEYVLFLSCRSFV